MAPPNKASNICVAEDFKIMCEKILQNFMEDTNSQNYEFPNTLTNKERAWVHNYAKKHYSSLKTKSHGNGIARKLILSKRSMDVTNVCRSDISIRIDNVLSIKAYLNQFSPRQERNEFLQLKARMKKIDCVNSKLGLGYGMPQQPAMSTNPELLSSRTQLPIWSFRNEIIDTIMNNQVVIICGHTGSGKTTQVPQFILDYNALHGNKCRIVCTQPRRISAIAVSDRVAVERSENIGQTVGYHIRLESCVSPKTALIYCTNGILLRTLMGGDTALETFTHIIVDEIHERDRFSDFLLISLRECLVNYPHIRLILMSATMDTNLYQEYFNHAPVLYVPGRQYHVNEYYLEDILSMVNYESQAMFNLKKKDIQSTTAMDSKIGSDIPSNSKPIVFENLVIAKKVLPSSNEPVSMSIDLQVELEHTIYECVNDGSDDSFNQLLSLILSDNAPINYQHPQTGYTGLMAAAMHGNLDMCIQLLSYGADMHLYSIKENYSAIDWAAFKNYMDCYYMFLDFQDQQLKQEQDVSTTLNESSEFISDEETKITLDLYHRSISDQYIDFDLLHTLLYYIYLKKDPGSILVFVAGYDDIINVRDRIIADTRFDPKKYQIITLHSLMQISDQSAVFKQIYNKRKIILSTNIAETSITIEDVKYVIDTGKVKEKCFDVLMDICSLQSNWISQAAAKQRAGRAGRTQPGECYHMFSLNRFKSMQEYATPEILRMPLHELCLQTKMLAPSKMKIAEFLALALEPPSTLAISSAIKHLQQIDALDETETLTLLGQHLVDLPVEPRLAKMLLYSVIFKCIDPILTIVAFESQRDPFILPVLQHQKIAAMKKRKKFSNGTFSDHMILLRVFQEWQEARLQRSERVFCNENFVSSATMDTVILIRSQLLAQLRATGFVRTKPPNDIRDLNENSNNWPLIKAILTAGLFPNIAYLNRSNMQIRNKKEKKLVLHNYSALRFSESRLPNTNNEHIECLKCLPSNWLIYNELSRSNTSYNIRSVTNVSAMTVALFADNSTTLTIHCDNEIDSSDEDVELQSSNNMIVINDWIAFEGNTLNLINSLRQKINILVMKKIANPYKHFTVTDENLIKLIANILLSEDVGLEFVQPKRIGNRPKIMITRCDVNRPARYRMGNNNKSQNSRYKNKNSNTSFDADIDFGNADAGAGAGATTDYTPLSEYLKFKQRKIDQFNQYHLPAPNQYNNDEINIDIETLSKNIEATIIEQESQYNVGPSYYTQSFNQFLPSTSTGIQQQTQLFDTTLYNYQNYYDYGNVYNNFNEQHSNIDQYQSFSTTTSCSSNSFQFPSPPIFTENQQSTTPWQFQQEELDLFTSNRTEINQGISDGPHCHTTVYGDNNQKFQRYRSTD